MSPVIIQIKSLHIFTSYGPLKVTFFSYIAMVLEKKTIEGINNAEGQWTFLATMIFKKDRPWRVSKK